jgi:hypothetical protein
LHTLLEAYNTLLSGEDAEDSNVNHI